MAKSFAWSYSKLKNYEGCPKKYYELDVAKNYPIEESDALLWGNQVHGALAHAVQGTTPLPLEMSGFQRWVNTLAAMPGELKVEQKYALTKEFQPTQWFGHNVWFRSIADAVKINGANAVAVDWKTGKILDDHSQLMLMAQCLFSHYPAVQTVRTAYVWLKDDCISDAVYQRNDISQEWVAILMRLSLLENAHRTETFPPKPGKMCRWCPVLSCPYVGKGVYK